MINEILRAVLTEVQAIYEGTGGQTMLKTNFKMAKMPTYTGLLTLLSLDNAEPSTQFPGGLTRMDWMFSFNTYNYEPDAYVDDPTSFSTDLLQPIDDIRAHFERGGRINPATGRIEWWTPGMYEVKQKYGFQFTMTGVSTADAIEANGLEMGYKIGFDSTGFDDSTLFIKDSVLPLAKVTQIDNPPFDGVPVS